MESFYSSQKYTRVEGICGDIQDYSLKTRTNKQPIGKIPGYEIILSHSLKYPRSKQGLRRLSGNQRSERGLGLPGNAIYQLVVCVGSGH
jgi:hypothetical protein